VSPEWGVIVFAEKQNRLHGDMTMIKTGSLFTQVLSLVDRNDFFRAVRQWDAEKGAKGFRCWDQFVSMVFCQLAAAFVPDHPVDIVHPEVINPLQDSDLVDRDRPADLQGNCREVFQELSVFGLRLVIIVVEVLTLDAVLVAAQGNCNLAADIRGCESRWGMAKRNLSK